MDTITGYDGSDDMDNDDEFEGEEDFDGGEEDIVIPPPDPKQAFLSLVSQIIALNGNSGAVYERLEATVAPYDKELAAHLRECKVADDRLIAYCQKKMEGR